MTQSGLAAFGISKSFDNRLVLDNVSLHVDRGEIVGLLGSNGSGKTVCFYCLIGLLRPNGGEVFLDGSEISDLAIDARARLGLGYLPQEASIFRGMTVSENIASVLETVEPDAEVRRKTLTQLLREFELEDVADMEAQYLATGERRLCEFARALAANPQILLLDEPLAGQGPLTVARIRQMLQRLKADNIGMLVTDHNVHDLLQVVDRAYLIHAGRLLFEGTPDELVANPEARRLYFGEDFHI